MNKKENINNDFLGILKEALKTVMKQRRAKYIMAVIGLVALILILNFTYAAFSAMQRAQLANIKVGKLLYSMKINQSELDNPNIVALPNKVTIAELAIKSLNVTATNYELIYEICESGNCSYQTITDFKIEYTSTTVDTIKGIINPDETKYIKVALLNDTDSSITVRFGINAGFAHNDLALLNRIGGTYEENDSTLRIAIKTIDLDDVETNLPVGSAFPLKKDYNFTSASCEPYSGTANPAPANVTPTFDTTAWTLSVTGIGYSTECTVVFTEKKPPLAKYIQDLYPNAPILAYTDNPNPFSQINAAEMTDEIPPPTNGIYRALDDAGGSSDFSYFFRGGHSIPNNVVFAGYQWKIIRVDKDGNVKLIYNGTCNNNDACITSDGSGINGIAATTNAHIGTSMFNSSWNSNAYVGIVYGNPTASTFPDTHYPTTPTNSTILGPTTGAGTSTLNGFLGTLKTKIAASHGNWSNYLATVNFCINRKVTVENDYPGNGVGTTVSTSYGRYRLYNNRYATLDCSQNSGKDRWSSYIGLITADEASMAGSYYGGSSNYYLTTGSIYWTLSPFYFYSNGNAYVFYVSAGGGLGGHANSVVNNYAVRPVIALSSTVEFSEGDGSTKSPYVIK